jgi:anthranilate/para-aminobenzoate synthase component II
MSIINLVMLLLVTNMVALFIQLNPKVTIIRPNPNYPHNYEKKVTLVTIVEMEWPLLGVQLVLVGLSLPMQTATRSCWVMRMTVLLAIMPSIIRSGN